MSAVTVETGKKLSKRWGWLAHIMLALGICLAGSLIYRTLRQYSFDEMLASVRALPAADLLRAALFAAGSYLCLTGFDWLALRYVGRPLPYRQAALTSFVSLSLGHNIGFAGLSSGAIRYRFYARWGLSAGEVAKLVLFCGLTVALGLLALGAVALTFNPDLATRLTGLDREMVRAVGLGCLLLVGLYLALAFGRSSITIWRWTLEMPRPALALAQVAIGSVNFGCVAGCLHALVSAVREVHYLDVAGAYVTGNVTALIAHVPGGLGVIEAAIMYLLPGGNLIGALIAFRMTYFFAPLSIGLATFAVAEAVFRGSGSSAEERPQKRE